MFRRFQLDVESAPLPPRTPRFEVKRDYDRCIGCGICVQACVYSVHSREGPSPQPSSQPSPRPSPAGGRGREGGDLTRMALPAHVECVGCQRCVNECPRAALDVGAHPEFAALGDQYYTPELVERLLYEAETGSVPSSGAGYRGPFTGPGFDALWTDFSEILRPARDGLDGKEPLSTEVSLGRKPKRLQFSLEGEIETRLAPETRLATPFLLLPPPFVAAVDERAALAVLAGEVAAASGAMLIVDEDVAPRVGSTSRGLRLSTPATADPARYAGWALVEVRDGPEAPAELQTIRAAAAVVTSVLVPFSRLAPARALELARAGADVIHLAATPIGKSTDEDKPLADGVRELERLLVEAGLREEVTVVASGGIARAEHSPKALLCGADAVGLDVAYLIALGLRKFDAAAGAWTLAQADLSDASRARQRLRNLIHSWREQLLAVMGAMGIREARRLQGEEGRALFFDELEKEFVARFAAPARKEFDPNYG